MSNLKFQLKRNSSTVTNEQINKYEFKTQVVGRCFTSSNSSIYNWMSNNQDVFGNATIILPNTPVDDYVIKSDDVTDDQTILIEGLDEDFKELSETVTLNGTSNVALVNEYTRINKISVIGFSSVVSSSISSYITPPRNAGNITVSNATTDLISIEAGIGVSLNGLYTVPINKKAILTNVRYTPNHDTSHNHNCYYEINIIQHDTTYDYDFNNGIVLNQSEKITHSDITITVNGGNTIIFLYKPSDANTNYQYLMTADIYLY